jgi:hypothetical protein
VVGNGLGSETKKQFFLGLPSAWCPLWQVGSPVAKQAVSHHLILGTCWEKIPDLSPTGYNQYSYCYKSMQVEDFLVSFLGLDSTLRDLFIFFFFPLASS